MSGDTAPDPEIKVELAGGVKGDIAELTVLPADADSKHRAGVDALKRRIAELFVDRDRAPRRVARPSQG